MADSDTEVAENRKQETRKDVSNLQSSSRESDSGKDKEDGRDRDGGKEKEKSKWAKLGLECTAMTTLEEKLQEVAVRDKRLGMLLSNTNVGRDVSYSIYFGPWLCVACRLLLSLCDSSRYTVCHARR